MMSMLDVRLFLRVNSLMSLMEYHENPNSPGRSCFVVPEGLRLALLTESHKGQFAGHLSEKKVYDCLKCHVWWRGMKIDVNKFC